MTGRPRRSDSGDRAARDRDSAYPAAPVSDQVDTYHGVAIADPYRPLEDADAPATRAWIAAENDLTAAFLARHPERGAIRDRLARLWDHPRLGAPWRRGDRWFQLRNSGLQDQDVVWVAGAPDAEGTVLFDPNRLSEDGTTALASVAVSESGAYAALALSHAGSDWRRWRVRDVATGEDLPDRVDWSKFASVAWTHDDGGFFYGSFPAPPPDAAYDAPNRDMELRYHRLGTDSTADPLVLATPAEPEWFFEPLVSEDGGLLVVTIGRGTDPETRIYVADLAGDPGRATVRPILDAADARYEPIAAVEGTIYLVTNLDAPLGRIVAIDAAGPARLRELVPAAGDAIEMAALVGDRLAVAYLHDARARLAIFELDGRPVAEVELPGIGSILGLSGRRRDDTLYVTFATFAEPTMTIAVRMADGVARSLPSPGLAWTPGSYVTEQAFVTSADGTRVPLFLTHRRGVRPNGAVATLLYGYGGFNVPIGPAFRPEWLLWLERGGLLAVASLRGGSEFGSEWYDAGRLEHKQNVFDDFAACLRWLAASGWTTPARIAISGRSNGGLLVGATLTQHPELFGAALAEVGVMDMLRFHRFTVGWGWTSDYGSADEPGQFRTLLGYSPLHNLRPATAYPATLITTADHDDRVVPGHSLKFAAALQAAQAGDAPVLIRVDTDAGHGVGKPVHKVIDERSDVLVFLELALGSAAAREVAGGPGVPEAVLDDLNGSGPGR